MKLSALMKKEFHRFFHDFRLIITMVLPGILIYIIYSLMGGVMNSSNPADFHYKVYVSGQSQATEIIKLAAGEGKLEYIYVSDIESAKQEVKDGKVTALMVFSENFDEEIDNYSPESELGKPSVKIYYRSGNEESFAFYNIATTVLDSFKNKFEINANANERFDYSETSDMAKSIMSGILPFIVVIMIFSSCMSITLESLAGEKERGTLATILATSVKRRDIALGKILPLSCISAIGAASSFLGIVLSMPKLIGTTVENFVGGFGFSSYLLLLLLIVSIVPLIVALISIVSTYARSVKEASAYTSVLMVFVMVLSLVSSFVPKIGDWVIAIPIINTVYTMQNILMLNISVWQCLVAIGLNIVYTGLLVFAISKMLSSEKIMFGT